MPYDVDLNCRERADISLGNLIPRETRLVLKNKKDPVKGMLVYSVSSLSSH
jgi:hypothetical protein